VHRPYPCTWMITPMGIAQKESNGPSVFRREPFVVSVPIDNRSNALGQEQSKNYLNGPLSDTPPPQDVLLRSRQLGASHITLDPTPRSTY